MLRLRGTKGKNVHSKKTFCARKRDFICKASFPPMAKSGRCEIWLAAGLQATVHASLIFWQMVSRLGQPAGGTPMFDLQGQVRARVLQILSPWQIVLWMATIICRGGHDVHPCGKPVVVVGTVTGESSHPCRNRRGLVSSLRNSMLCGPLAR